MVKLINSEQSAFDMTMRGEVSDPLLAFVACSRKSSSTGNIKTIILAKFTLEQLKTSIGKLWDCRGATVLGELQERKDGKTRSAKEAYAEDLLCAFSKLDEKDDLPEIVVSADDLPLVPRIHPEEIEMVSMAERLNKVELAVSSMRDVISGLGEVMTDSDSPQMALQGQQNARSREQRGAGSANPNGNSLPRRLTRSQSRPSETSLAASAAAPSSIPLDGPRPRTTADIVSDIPDGAFAEVKKVKRPVKNKAQVGKAGDASQSFKGGSDTFKVQITNVNQAVNEQDIVQHIGTAKVDASKVKVEDTTTSGWPTKRFLITFARDDFETVMSPEFWPAKVYFRQYFIARGNGRNNGHNHG